MSHGAGDQTHNKVKENIFSIFRFFQFFVIFYNFQIYIYFFRKKKTCVQKMGHK